MPDEPSAGELGRTLVRVEAALASEVRRLGREHATDIQRLEREHAEDLRKLREDVIRPLSERLGKVEGRPAMSVTRWLGVVTVGLMLAALLVQAYGTIRGAK